MFESKSIAVNLGLYSEISENEFIIKMEQLLQEKSVLYKMSKRAVDLMDGMGVVRIAQYIVERINNSDA